ncbi:MAG: iron complex transport system ATP-binding protein, partial [Thermoproteota archaeon]|nr:iron complex transport system ATP-binding protein [Thermoproteota archaeon]
MILSVEDAEFSYEKDKNVFRNVSFTIEKGDIFCILGPNGSGKTTLLKCIDYLIKLTCGRIILDGKEIQSLSRKEI